MRVSSHAGTQHTQSTGLVLHHNGFLVFAFGQQLYWQEGVIPVIGIGGKREPGESFEQAVRREAREEAGVAVRLLSSHRTWLFRHGDPPTGVDVDDRPRPLYIWDRPITLGAGMPPRPYFCVVYEAEALGAPAPSGEIPALLHVNPRGMELLASERPPCVSELLETGSRVKAAVDVPGEALLVPQGSAEYLVKYEELR